MNSVSVPSWVLISHHRRILNVCRHPRQEFPHSPGHVFLFEPQAGPVTKQNVIILVARTLFWSPRQFPIQTIISCAIPVTLPSVDNEAKKILIFQRHRQMLCIQNKVQRRGTGQARRRTEVSTWTDREFECKFMDNTFAFLSSSHDLSIVGWKAFDFYGNGEGEHPEFC